LDELKTAIKGELANLDVVIGWKQGFDPLHATPHFMRTEEDVDQLIWSPLCVQNLATYLTGFKGKKVGVVVKGCDSRSVVELLQEGLISREDITVFGLTCSGAVDLVKLRAELGGLGRVRDVWFENDELVAVISGEEHRIALKEVLLDKCRGDHPVEPVISDYHFKDSEGFDLCGLGERPGLDELENMSLEERFAHWNHHMDRCIRCYACRNACPMCVCRDHCIAETRDPHWLSQETDLEQKWMFQLIHVTHLAGRCTECGECERSCPMDIPILALRQKLNREIKEVFDYQAGMNPEAVPPLMTFKVEEENINERGW
jgi:ferredoxin